MLSLQDSLRSSTHKGSLVSGWPTCLGETLLPWKSKDKKWCLYKTLYVTAPIWVLGDIIAKFYALCMTFYRRTYNSWFFFLVHEWCVSEETRLVISRLLCKMTTRRSTSKRGTKKDYLLHMRSPTKSTFKHLCKQTPLWLVVMSKMPQEPWRSRWPWEMDVEQAAPTHARHTHCASRQLGTTADRRYDVPWVWLWDACPMARVRWGTRCKGFCSKEGSTTVSNKVQGTNWNIIKCKERLWSCPEAVVRQATINLDSRLWKSLGDSLPELYCVDLA